jgi:7-cyano-7-deazaguanine synthase
MKKIVLLSGGLDSTTLMWSLLPDVKALLFDYGQRHRKELIGAKMLCEDFGIECKVADLRGITHLISKGSQSGDAPVPEGHYAEESMKTTIVPNRNSIMLSVACGWALASGSEEVYFAAHGGDHAIYPDCRAVFVDAFDHAMRLANEWDRISVHAPFVKMSKADIVTLAQTIGVPLDRTWSCYKGESLHCGVCGTCVERKEAFQLAGVEDPTIYA